MQRKHVNQTTAILIAIEQPGSFFRNIRDTITGGHIIWMLVF